MNAKRILSLVIALCLLVSATMTTAFAVVINDVPTDITMTAFAVKNDNGNYRLKLTAKMTMSKSLAQAAVIQNSSRLDSLTFVCKLSLPAMMNIDWNDVEISTESFNVTGPGTKFTYGGKDFTMYEFVSIKRTGNDIEIVYKLTDEAKANLRYLGADGGVAALRKEIMFTSKEIDDVTITNFGDGIVKSTVTVKGYGSDILAAKGQVDIYLFPKDTNEDDSIKIIINETFEIPEDDEPIKPISQVTVITEDPVPGSTVEFKVEPASGRKLTGITIRSEEGTELDFEYTGDGVFDFVLPNGDVIIEATFADAPYSTSASGVDTLLNTEDHIAYVIGYEDGTFRPYNNATRAEVAMMFYRLLREPEIEITGEFKDVSDTAWYATAVKTLATLGIFKGDNGYVYPDRPITRAEFVAVCVRFATNTPYLKENIFSDVSESHWAYNEIIIATSFGWIQGFDGKFEPDRYITRSEVCTVINRMLGRPVDYEAIDQNHAHLYPDIDHDADWAYYQISEATYAHEASVDHVWNSEDWLED